MSAAVNLANEDSAALCLALMEKHHAEQDLPYDDAHRLAVATPLLAGNPLGAIWLIGGMVGWIAEIYMRPSVRKRGIGTETLHAVAVALRAGGVKALHADVGNAENPLTYFWKRVGFQPDTSRSVMTDILS